MLFLFFHNTIVRFFFLTHQQSSQTEDKVFKNVYIPRSLNDVADVERDLRMASSGRANEVTVYFAYFVC